MIKKIVDLNYQEWDEDEEESGIVNEIEQTEDYQKKFFEVLTLVKVNSNVINIRQNISSFEAVKFLLKSLMAPFPILILVKIYLPLNILMNLMRQQRNITYRNMIILF